MITVLFSSFVKKENQETFIAVAKEHAALSLKDKGCVRFDVLEPSDEEIKFVEIWENKECLDLHAKRSSTGQEAPKMNALRYDKKMEIYAIL